MRHIINIANLGISLYLYIMLYKTYPVNGFEPNWWILFLINTIFLHIITNKADHDETK